jgi:hypothetical protein
MERIPVTSSNVAEVGYEPASMTLEIAFCNGNVYQYFDVPEMVYQEFIGSDSVGTYLNANIKNSYRYAKV